MQLMNSINYKIDRLKEANGLEKSSEQRKSEYSRRIALTFFHLLKICYVGI